MKQLIVNADDFGLTAGVNAGIVRAFREGILTSTTLMANGAAFSDAVEQAKSNPELGVGCHLVLVSDRAIAPREEVASLVDRNGRLPASLFSLVAKLASGRVRVREIENEFRAQIVRVRSAGIEPTHLDTHKHTHSIPQVMDAMMRVAQESGISRVRKPYEDAQHGAAATKRNGNSKLRQRALAAAARSTAPRFGRLVRQTGVRTPDYFYGIHLTGSLRNEALLEILETLPDGTSELMSHPGLCDAALQQMPTRLKHQREQELAALIDPAVRRVVERQGIHLISYRELN
jgi:hopanoid biosynthesis associated protein HpnK